MSRFRPSRILTAVDRKEIDEGHRLIALYADAHDDLIKALKIRYFEPTKQEQAAYELARAFWVREYPAMRERLIEALGTDTQLEHSFYVLRKSFEPVRVDNAIHQLRDYAHVKDVDEARTAARDLWERYEAHLNRQAELLPTRAEERVATVKSVGAWIASRPEWIQTHQAAAFYMTIWALILLVTLGIVSPLVLQAITELIRSR
jgi:hypothetical protein